MGEVSKTVARKPDVKKENSASRSQRILSSHSENPSIDRILFLQRTVGNHAVQKLIKSGRLQANLRISQPGDIYEQEAEKVAEQVVSSTPATQVTSIKGLPGDGKQVQRKEGISSVSSPDSVIRNPSQGQPINSSTKSTLESHLRADLSNVKVHNDSSAHEAASALNAKAFTYGNNIWLGKGESQNNMRLMAHETTHVVQQDHSISRMPFGNKTSTPALAVRHTNGAVVQRSIFSPLKNLVENQIENQIWEQLNKYAPELVQIIKKGIFVWLEEKITSVVDNLFNTLMAPVRSLTGIVQSVSKHFTSLLAWMQEAAVKISKGDCSSISEAAEKIGKVIDGLASPIIDKVKNLAKKVGNFFTGLWDRFGAPVWDFLKSAGGAAWEKIQQLGKMIWDKTAPVRKVFSRAWGWIKNKLGIGEETEGQNKQGKGEETEGQNGILQWVKRKASELWDDKIKPFVIRFKKPLIVVAGVLVMLSPAGPLVAIGAGVVGLIKGIRWISQYMKKPQNVAQQQGALKEIILPGLMGAVNSVKAALRKASIFVTNSLNKVIEGLTQALSAVSGSVLNFVVGALQWITDQFQGLVAWANEKLTSLVDVISTGLERLNEFLYPIFGVLEKIGDVVSDIMNLSSLVLGKLWNMIPACIRNPLINFLINQILKNIPILGDVIELVPTLWSEIKVTALTIIKKVFKDGDLIGATFEIFKLVLRVLNIPMELLVSVIAKAGSAIDHVIKKPFVFLGNLLKAIKNGFIQFGKNILSHLLSGLKNWLFGAVAGLGIHLPEDLSIKSIFNFILEVLDITVEKVLVRLEKKFGPGKIAPVRKAIRVISQVWDWISTLLEEGPQGVWNKLKEKLGDLWSTLIGEISTWITVNVVVNAIARLSTTLAGGPVGPVVQGLISLYKAIQSVMRYARQLLEIVDLVLDNVTTIVSGSIGAAATKVEDALERSLTVALGFLANQVGLGNLEKKVSKIMESIRNKIIDGIDWLINKALKVGGALIGLVKGKGKKKKELPPDERKEAAKKEFISFMKAKKSMSKEEMERVFVKLKTEYQLSDIKLEGNHLNPKIGFYASPATFLPIKPIDDPHIVPGQKDTDEAKTRPSVKENLDYIKPIAYDGPHLTPGREIEKKLNERFEGKETTYDKEHPVDSPGTPPPTKKAKKGTEEEGKGKEAKKLIVQKAEIPKGTFKTFEEEKGRTSYRRAGSVEAKSSVTRGKNPNKKAKDNRSGDGETIFGYMGSDEEKICTGGPKTEYNGGHLVGDQIMDSFFAFNLYEDWNLAPQQRYFNYPVYEQLIESPVTEAIEKKKEKEEKKEKKEKKEEKECTVKVLYTVKVQYPADTYEKKPSEIIKNTFKANCEYRKEVEGAISLDKVNSSALALDAPFHLKRRTPGFWKAKAEVVSGENTICSHKVSKRDDVVLDNPDKIKPGTEPFTGDEKVRYSLQIDEGKEGGWVAQKIENDQVKYANAKKVKIKARQKTFKGDGE